MQLLWLVPCPAAFICYALLRPVGSYGRMMDADNRSAYRSCLSISRSDRSDRSDCSDCSDRSDRSDCSDCSLWCQVARLRGKGVYSVCVSDGCSAAISIDGRLYTWGSGTAGQLGHGHHFGLPEPKPVPFFADGIKVVQVRCSAGVSFSWFCTCHVLWMASRWCAALTMHGGT